jgi:hypothetical protein
VTTIVIASHELSTFVEGGGHFWVYMQYAQALRQLGCDVYWLEQFREAPSESGCEMRLAKFRARMADFGFGEKLILYRERTDGGPGGSSEYEYIGAGRHNAEDIFRRSDLLLNFHYAMNSAQLGCFRRTALVDIDPGLLQFWISRRQIKVQPHDLYFTTGETVGTPDARFPDCGLAWQRIRPPVCLELWPAVRGSDSGTFTTVSNWQGADWIQDGEVLYENTKRAAFLPFSELPRLTPQALELALFLTDQDIGTREFLEARGWRVRLSTEVAGTPARYQAYIQQSRGEFSCAKPTCMLFQNAWVSDRTLCYLASGKPVAVQHTGRSTVLPDREGMFRFSTIGEAVEALATINADYKHHSRAARELAETYFDANRILETILNLSLNRYSVGGQATLQQAVIGPE